MLDDLGYNDFDFLRIEALLRSDEALAYLGSIADEVVSSADRRSQAAVALFGLRVGRAIASHPVPSVRERFARATMLGMNVAPPLHEDDPNAIVEFTGRSQSGYHALVTYAAIGDPLAQRILAFPWENRFMRSRSLDRSPLPQQFVNQQMPRDEYAAMLCGEIPFLTSPVRTLSKYCPEEPVCAELGIPFNGYSEEAYPEAQSRSPVLTPLRAGGRWSHFATPRSSIVAALRNAGR